MLKRPTLLCRRSSEEEHEFVVAFPEESGPEATEHFVTRMEIQSYRPLSGNRIAFTLRQGPALTGLIREAFSGRIGGFPVVRALMHPESFSAERSGKELEATAVESPASSDLSDGSDRSDRRQARAKAGAPRLATGIAIGVAFFAGVALSVLINGSRPSTADVPVRTAPVVKPRPVNVAVDLGTFVTAKGPVAAFVSKDGTLRYAQAGGALEGRLHSGIEIRTRPDVVPGLFTPVHELREAEGTFVFDSAPAVASRPPLEQYAPCFGAIPDSVLLWGTLEDSTRSFYALRTAWRTCASEFLRLEGNAEESEDGWRLHAGPVTVILANLDEIDLLNLSMGTSEGDRVHVYGRIAEEFAWEDLRFHPRHPAFCLCVDWVEAEQPALLCRADGI